MGGPFRKVTLCLDKEDFRENEAGKTGPKEYREMMFSLTRLLELNCHSLLFNIEEIYRSERKLREKSVIWKRCLILI